MKTDADSSIFSASITSTSSVIDKYTFNLGEKYRIIAKEELHEDDSVRQQTLIQLREWILKHSKIKNCRIDSKFLLRFLRTKKYSFIAASQMLEKYLTMRQMYPNWIQNLDPFDETLARAIDDGFMFPLRERDKYGRRIIFCINRNFDVKRFASSTMAKLHFLTLECLFEEEETQIAGCTIIYDQRFVAPALMSIYSLNDIRKLVNITENGLPNRLKTAHHLGLPSFMNKIMEFCLSLFRKKFKERIIFSHTIEDLTKHIDVKILPAEYGGETTISELINDFKELLANRRETLLALDQMHIELLPNEDADIYGTSKNCEIDCGTIGSFRNLLID